MKNIWPSLPELINGFGVNSLFGGGNIIRNVHMLRSIEIEKDWSNDPVYESSIIQTIKYFQATISVIRQLLLTYASTAGDYGKGGTGILDRSGLDD